MIYLLIYLLKFKALSIVTPYNFVRLLIVIDPIFQTIFFKRFFFPSIINWNFLEFALKELILNEYRSLFISCSRLFRITGRLLPWETKVLSSAKLQMPDFSTTRKMSLIKILKSKGPNIEPWEIPWMISAQSLHAEPVFILCLQ